MPSSRWAAEKKLTSMPMWRRSCQPDTVTIVVSRSSAEPVGNAIKFTMRQRRRQGIRRERFVHRGGLRFPGGVST